MEIEKYNYISLTDYSDFIAEKSTNGGCYSTGLVLNKQDGYWEVLEWSSCEMIEDDDYAMLPDEAAACVQSYIDRGGDITEHADGRLRIEIPQKN